MYVSYLSLIRVIQESFPHFFLIGLLSYHHLQINFVLLMVLFPFPQINLFLPLRHHQILLFQLRTRFRLFQNFHLVIKENHSIYHQLLIILDFILLGHFIKCFSSSFLLIFQSTGRFLKFHEPFFHLIAMVYFNIHYSMDYCCFHSHFKYLLGYSISFFQLMELVLCLLMLNFIQLAQKFTIFLLASSISSLLFILCQTYSSFYLFCFSYHFQHFYLSFLFFASLQLIFIISLISILIHLFSIIFGEFTLTAVFPNLQPFYLFAFYHSLSFLLVYSSLTFYDPFYVYFTTSFICWHFLVRLNQLFLLDFFFRI